MKTELILSQEALRDKAVIFFQNYTPELESFKTKTIKHLQKLADLYIKENELPAGSVSVLGRTKTLQNSLKKLEYKGWPQFNYLPEVITDLIGVRFVCWFLDDCHGIEKYLGRSEHFKILETENYIRHPKKSGYRAIHLVSGLSDRDLKNKLNTSEFKFPFEIQIRTKLQDAWGDISHEFYYKTKTTGIVNKKYESFLEQSSARLYSEDKTLNKFKLIWETIKDDDHNGESELYSSGSALTY